MNTLHSKPPFNEVILYEDCQFYTVQDIPNVAGPTIGEWDLRKNLMDYLGNVDFTNKSVLELGPASGFLTFEVEKMGADVLSVELSLKDDFWDVVPNVSMDWYSDERNHMIADLTKVQKAYWFAHERHNSKAKVLYSHASHLQKLESRDISLLCSVLLHIQNPFLAMKNMLRFTKEKAIITDLMPYGALKSGSTLGNIKRVLMGKKVQDLPYMQFLPSVNGEHNFAWWMMSPECVVQMAALLGFERSIVTRHVQYQNGLPRQMFTVVAERTMPMDKCFYY